MAATIGNFWLKLASPRKRLLLLAGLFVSVMFLWLALRQVRLESVRHDLGEHVQLWLGVPFLVCYGAFFWIKALRWSLLLEPVSPASTAQLFPSVIIGYAGNLLFPAQLGEVLRSYILGYRLRLKNSPILATIVLERLFDFVTIFLLFTIALLTTSQSDFPSLRAASYVMCAVALGVAGILGIYLYRTRAFLQACRRLSAFLPTKLHNYLLGQLESAAQGLESARTPRLLTGILTTSLAMWVAMSGATYFAMLALNIEAPFSAAVITLVFVVIGFLLPSAPGYIGTVQLGFVLGLGPYGVAADIAIAASIFYNLLITVPPMLLALALAARLGYMSRTAQISPVV